MQRRAEALRWHHAQVDLDAAREHHARARAAARQDLLHLAVAGEAPQRVRGVPGGDQDVEVADGFPHAAETARHDDLFDAARRTQVLDERPGVLRGERELVAPLFAEMRLHRLEQLLLGLGAETGQAAQAPVARRAVQLLRGMHVSSR